MPTPQHVAIIRVGNGRSARSRGLPRAAAHRAGKVVRRVVEACARRDFCHLALFDAPAFLAQRELIFGTASAQIAATADA